MLAFLECSEGSVIRVTASGELTRADHVAFLERIESMFREKGRAHILFELKEFKGWENNGEWDEPTFSLRCREAVKRLALVGDDCHRSWMIQMGEPFANVRFFHPVEHDQAWRWLTESVEDELEKERIRRVAYTRWEAAGHPPGDGVSFWLEAERDLHQVGATGA